MKYSIITPIYNREDCIQRCIDSVCRNLKWGIELEHIIVNDGSSDRTESIIQRNADRFNHITFINFDQNRGTNAARNAAIQAASGDFCIILDSDDYFIDDAIKIINQTMISSSFKHYMFAADDMVVKYSSNPLLSKELNIISYEDFSQGICPVVGLLGRMVVLFVVF